jgi:hypothetical protein
VVVITDPHGGETPLRPFAKAVACSSLFAFAEDEWSWN